MQLKSVNIKGETEIAGNREIDQKRMVKEGTEKPVSRPWIKHQRRRTVSWKSSACGGRRLRSNSIGCQNSDDKISPSLMTEDDDPQSLWQPSTAKRSCGGGGSTCLLARDDRGWIGAAGTRGPLKDSKVLLRLLDAGRCAGGRQWWEGKLVLASRPRRAMAAAS